MVCIFLKIPIVQKSKHSWFLQKEVTLIFKHAKNLWIGAMAIVHARFMYYFFHCNKLSRFWFLQLGHKYQVRFATNSRSGGPQTARKPLVEMIASWVCNDSAAGKKGRWWNLAINLWQTECKPIFSGSHSDIGVIIHRQKALDEPSSVLQLSNLSMSKITSSPRFRNLCTTPLYKVLYKVSNIAKGTTLLPK